MTPRDSLHPLFPHFNVSYLKGIPLLADDLSFPVQHSIQHFPIPHFRSFLPIIEWHQQLFPVTTSNSNLLTILSLTGVPSIFYTYPHCLPSWDSSGRVWYRYECILDKTRSFNFTLCLYVSSYLCVLDGLHPSHVLIVPHWILPNWTDSLARLEL